MSYSGIFSDDKTYLQPCIILAYSGPCHIQNPDLFRKRDIFKTLSRHVLLYSGRCVMVAYWEPCHIQNFKTRGIFRTARYNNIISSSHFNLTYFSTKINIFWLQWRQFRCSTESTKKTYNLWKYRYNKTNKTHVFLGKQVLW